MKRRSFEIAAAVILTSTLSLPSFSAQGTVEISAVLPKSCNFNGDLTASILMNSSIQQVGSLSLTCNYTGTIQVQMMTDDGTVLKSPDEPGAEALYRIRWTNPSPEAIPWFSSGTGTTFGAYTSSTGPNYNVARSSTVEVQVLDPSSIGGTYTDTVVFMVSP
ncbi:MAG: hypothetical protein ACK6DM_03025 [Alphaproteobacteria bacterium]|jgi:hypothetical protein